MKAKPDSGLISAVLAPFFIALSIIVTKMAGKTAHPLVVACIGSLISVPLLLLLCRLTRIPLSLNKLFTDGRRALIAVVLSRSVLGQSLIVSGFTMTTAVKAVLLLRLEPLFVFLWSTILRGERPKRNKVFLLLLLLIGSALVVAPHGSEAGPNFGDGLIVLALVFLSYSYFPTEKAVKLSTPVGVNVATNLLGGMALLFIALICLPHGQLEITGKALSLIAAYSVTFFVCGSTLYFYAFKRLKPWVIASFLSLEVVFGLVLAYYLLHESISLLQLFGAAVVLAATVGVAYLARAHAQKTTALEPDPSTV